jgi:chromosome segregation ATPase
VTELDEIRQRLGELEQRVDVLEDGQSGSRRAAELFAVVDRDVGDLKEAFTAQRHVLQALRDTQLEQGRALGGIIVTLQSIQETLAEHSTVLNEHTTVLAEHTTVLNEHSTVLAEHTTVLNEHSTVLAGHGRVLARLDPGEDPV